MTWNEVVKIEPAGSWNDLNLEIAYDASFAPGGDRSRSGVVISLNGQVVHHASNKQSLTSVSSCEAEINAGVMGLKLGLAIRDVVEEASGEGVKLLLVGDNTAAMRSVMTDVTSWRNRHYAMRAAFARDLIGLEKVDVIHRSGKDLVSDALTKVLERQKLTEARSRLGMVTL